MPGTLPHTDPGTPLPALLDRLNTDGVVVLPSVLSPARREAIREALAPYLAGTLTGRNDFEGYRSERVYALLAKSPVFAELVAEPLVLDVCEAILGPNFLLGACLAINTHPGETAQPLHFDDSFYKVPRPRPAYGISTFWNIDEFTVENGATEVIPGSHRWGDEVPIGAAFDDSFKPGFVQPDEHHPGLVSAVMPPGSLMIAMGTLWHRGGANTSRATRLVITPQYCAAWCRQMETMLLSVPPAIVASYPPRVQRLLGYDIHPPFMGHVNGMHPKRILDAAAATAKETST